MRLFVLFLLSALAAALPIDVVEKMQSENGRRILRHQLSAKASDSLRRMIGTNLEGRKARLRRISEKMRWNSTVATEGTVKRGLLELTEIVTEEPPTDAPVGILETNDAEGVSDYLFQGDIHLTDAQLDALEDDLQSTSTRRKRQVSRTAAKWPGNTVYYYFDSSMTTQGRSAVTAALSYLSSKTCVNFQQSSSAQNRIRVYRGNGCMSALGMTGGEQQLSLGNGCEYMGTAAHEFSHALGVYHTHMRPDRDTFITLNTAVVDPALAYNFDKLSSGQIFTYVPYEYGSIMHYPATAFSNGGISMIAKDSRYTYTMGSHMISFFDLKVINDHYGCTAICSSSTSAKCKNGGTPNPRNCATCICPLGYGGTLCDQRPSGCGEALTATSEWQSKTYSYGNQNDRGLRVDYDLCNHWISAPAGQKVQMKVTSVYNGQCSYGCPFNGIEIKMNTNQQQTNPRFCCDSTLNKEITSELNPTPVISFNKVYYTTFTIEYRAVGGGPSPGPGPSSGSGPSPGNCVDSSSNCPGWVSSGFCTNTFYSQDEKKQYCAKSCNLCSSSSSPSSCSDANTNCAAWKTSGFCTNSFYTTEQKRQFCAASCGLC